jgi:hypothetical protein
MKNLRRIAIVALGLISGCVQHTWAPGPEATKSLGVGSGECKLVAMSGAGGGGYVMASGSPQFVGTAVGSAQIGNAVGTAVRQQNIFNACMEAQGFVATDQLGERGPSAVLPSAVATDETVRQRARDTCASMDHTLGAFTPDAWPSAAPGRNMEGRETTRRQQEIPSLCISRQAPPADHLDDHNGSFGWTGSR